VGKLALVVLMVGCSGSSGGSDAAPPGDLAGYDFSSSDQAAAPDFSARDLASASDGPPGGDSGGARCNGPGDCRLFSSYCVTSPCVCFALGATEPDPPCTAGMVSCLIDPCSTKTADCQGGMCVAQ